MKLLPNSTTPDSEKNGSALTSIPQIINNTNYIATTTKEIATTIPETKKDEETHVVLLGFNQFEIFDAYFTFYLYLTAIKNFLYTKFILFPMIIIQNGNIRRLLKETKANCTLDLIESDINYRYYCNVTEDSNNIKEIKLIPEFDFTTQDNVTYKNNTYNNILENSLVYIMDNSTLYRNHQFLFNITGEIEDPQPKLENKNITLMINLENEIDEKTEVEVQCNISNITRNNYILYCKSNETFLGELQNAISFIDNNDLLLLNFANINDSIIDIEANTNSRRFFIKNGSKLGAGAIVGIIIPIIAVIALIIFLVFYLRNKNKIVAYDYSESSVKAINY